VYRSSFEEIFSGFSAIKDDLLDAFVGGQLVSSLLAVCCVTVSFCSNMLMVQDKVNGARRDIMMTPISTSVVSLAYFFASFVSTLVISLTALAAGLVYLSVIGWYLSFADVLLLISDVFMLTLFGTALSSLINFFLSSQAQISAVGSIVSAGYGFICGAYMPISQFSEVVRNVVSFLPGTYATSILRTHATSGVFAELEKSNIPTEILDGLADSIDCNVYIGADKISAPIMYTVLIGSIVMLLVAYVTVNIVCSKKTK
jgi:multidrug/hemolysin transport system permease protein